MLGRLLARRGLGTAVLSSGSKGWRRCSQPGGSESTPRQHLGAAFSTTSSQPGGMDDLLRALTPSPTSEPGRFECAAYDMGWGQTFGGLLVAQALASASAHIRASHTLPHSLHAYFLNRGKGDLPVTYDVVTLREAGGGERVTAHVLGHQGPTNVVSVTTAFHPVTGDGLTHTDIRMPSGIPLPDTLPDDVDLRRILVKQIKKFLRPEQFGPLTVDRPFNVKVVNPTEYSTPKKKPPARSVWIRVGSGSPLPTDPLLHRLLIAFLSDYHLVGTSLLPHGVTYFTPGYNIASMDHSVWFHRQPVADRWLLHHLHSPTAAGGRGFARGHLWDSTTGELIATVSQEILLRKSSRADS